MCQASAHHQAEFTCLYLPMSLRDYIYILSHGLVKSLPGFVLCPGSLDSSLWFSCISLCHSWDSRPVSLDPAELGFGSDISVLLRDGMLCFLHGMGKFYWKSSDILTKVLQQLCFVLKLNFLKFRGWGGGDPLDFRPTLSISIIPLFIFSARKGMWPIVKVRDVIFDLPLWGRTSHLKRQQSDSRARPSRLLIGAEDRGQCLHCPLFVLNAIGFPKAHW